MHTMCDSDAYESMYASVPHSGKHSRFNIEYSVMPVGDQISGKGM